MKSLKNGRKYLTDAFNFVFFQLTFRFPLVAWLCSHDTSARDIVVRSFEGSVGDGSMEISNLSNSIFFNYFTHMAKNKLSLVKFPFSLLNFLVQATIVTDISSFFNARISVTS